MGSLAIFSINYGLVNKTYSGIRKKLWSVSGDKRNTWIKKEITLRFEKPQFYQVRTVCVNNIFILCVFVCMCMSVSKRALYNT